MVWEFENEKGPLYINAKGRTSKPQNRMVFQIERFIHPTEQKSFIGGVNFLNKYVYFNLLEEMVENHVVRQTKILTI